MEKNVLGTTIAPDVFFSEWSDIDFKNFFELCNQEYFLSEIKRIEHNVNKNNLVLNVLGDFFLLDSNVQQKVIWMLISRLKPSTLEKIGSILGQEFRTSHANDLDYKKAFELLKSNVSPLMHMLGIYIDPIVNFGHTSIQGVTAIFPKVEIRDYQQQCCKDILSLMENGQHRGLLHLPTGAGKTRTAINIACDYLRNNKNQFVVWLADTSELCSQAAETFAFIWGNIGNRTINRFCMFSDYEFSLSGAHEGFAVLGLQKLRSLQSGHELDIVINEFVGSTGLVIFDEAHKSLAPTYSNILESFQNENTFILGLTATPGRSLYDEEENNRLSELFHNNKVSIRIAGYASPIEYLQEMGYLAKPEFIRIEYDVKNINFQLYTELSEDEFFKSILSNDHCRNFAIIQCVKKHIENQQHSRIIIFSCSLEHSKQLQFMLAEQGINCKSIDSNTNKFARADFIKRFSDPELDVQVLINYAVLTAGFDAPKTDSVIICRPTNSLIEYMQMAGRAMRGKQSGGNSNCTIYTVYDGIEEYQNMFNANAYWDSNWE